MVQVTAQIEFLPLRNDLANIPSSLAGLLFNANIPAQLTVLELKGKDRSVFCGWTGLSSAKQDTIELDPTFATNLGLVHGQKCCINVVNSPSVAHSVLLEPLTQADWEIVETHAAFLENFMINQVRAVCIGDSVVVFPSPTTLATLKVATIDPPPKGTSNTAARISPDCEVIIAPKTKEKPEDEKKTLPAPALAIQSCIERCSVHPYLPNLTSRKLEIRGNLPLFKSGSKIQVTLALPPTVSSPATNSDEQEVVRSRSVVATYIHDSSNAYTKQGPNKVSGLSYGLSCALGLAKDSVGDRVLVKSLPSAHFPVITATIRPFTFSATPKVTLNKPISLNSDQREELGVEVIGKGLVVAPHATLLPNGGIIDTETKEWGTVSKLQIGAETPLAESKRMKLLESDTPASRPIVGQDDLIQKVEKALSGTTNGVFLYGSRGCGKSVLIKELCSRLRARNVKPLQFRCGTYTDKALPTVRDALKKLSHEAAWHAPSVVVFDDLDKLIPAQQEHSGDSARQQQIAEVFRNIWMTLLAQGQVSIIGTAQDQTEIHSYLITSHLFETIVHLKSPDKELREHILRAAVNTSGLEASDDLDLLEVVAETEGYQPGDLWILVDRLSSILALQDEVEVNTSTFIAAATDFTPASLRGVSLEKPSIDWEEVGGLVSAKRLVLETLDWPTKYAPVFANCPLRLRSGLLFYGYPGCGKTMLASAIARKTGLNFISVKGPEILNKYIGASEQSVRDLFDRAQAAKPCVLFFDEFDSIAPKRGHDATGVTDRVVNQLLTQMDGAEGLDGVYVLAATSRPDLIDSALLRPGRLDKSIICDMPDHESRVDILKRAAKKLKLENDVDLDFVAKGTQGYSGADLQALIYNAYLTAVHDVLNASAEKANSPETSNSGLRGFQIGTGDLELAKEYVRNKENGPLVQGPEDNSEEIPTASSVRISNKDILTALKESKPSISPKEVAKFKAIYSEFSTDRPGEMPPGTSSNAVGGRVTLQ